MRLWFMGLGLWTALSGGCVTDTISFDREPIEPPVILDSPTFQHKIGDVFFVDRTADETMWKMHVLVRERDVNRPLTAHHRLVEPLADPMDRPQFVTVTVPLGSVEEPELRDLEFTVSTTLLQPSSCHQLQLVVSGSFEPDETDPGFFAFVRDNKDDISWARWWVWEGTRGSIDKPAELIESCNAGEVLPMPSAAPSETEGSP